MNGRLFRATLVLELRHIAKAWWFWLAMVPSLLVSYFAVSNDGGRYVVEEYGRVDLFVLTLFAVGVAGAVARGTLFIEFAMSRPASPRLVLTARLTAYAMAIAVVGLGFLALTARQGIAQAAFVDFVLIGTLLAAVSYALVTEPRSIARRWVPLAILTYLSIVVFWWDFYEITIERWMIATSPYVLAACFIAAGLLGWSQVEPVIDADSSSAWRRSGWTFGFWVIGAYALIVLGVLALAVI